MSSPFSSVGTNGQPTWGAIVPASGNFVIVDVLGGIHADEVGYGQGGYGQDGYDTPPINVPGVAQPLWVVETTK